MGAVVPLYHLRRSVQLVPKFGEKADPTLTPQTSFNASHDFFLNQYFDKEDFFYLRIRSPQLLFYAPYIYLQYPSIERTQYNLFIVR